MAQVMNDKLGIYSEATRCVAIPQMTEATVSCDLINGCLETYATSLAKAVFRELPLEFDGYDEAGEKKRKGLVLLLVEYMTFVVCARIQQINDERLLCKPTSKMWFVPAFLNVVLEGIGRVESREFGVTLIPKLSPEQQRFYNEHAKDEGWFVETSRDLKRYFAAAHIEYAEGLPKSVDGNFDLMTFAVIDDDIVGLTNRPHPVYALMAGFLHLKMLETVLVGHVKYGEMSQVMRDVGRVVTYEQQSGGRDR